MVIYSLAAGVRPKPHSDTFWRSVIKPIGESVTGASILLENDQWVETTLEPATEEEAEATIKVMGGKIGKAGLILSSTRNPLLKVAKPLHSHTWAQKLLTQSILMVL